jgi:hypothetical protein
MRYYVPQNYNIDNDGLMRITLVLFSVSHYAAAANIQFISFAFNIVVI